MVSFEDAEVPGRPIETLEFEGSGAWKGGPENVVDRFVRLVEGE